MATERDPYIFLRILQQAHDLKQSIAVIMAMPDHPATIIMTPDRVLSASWKSKRGIHALVVIATLTSGVDRTRPATNEDLSIDEIGMLTLPLIDDLKRRIDRIVENGIHRMASAFIADMPTSHGAHDDPWSLIKDGQAIVRTRTRSQHDPDTESFPKDFFSGLDDGQHHDWGPMDDDAWTPPEPGMMIGKCYLAARIGKGSTSAVYRAMHMSLKTDVAIKIFKPKKQAMGGISEANLLASMNHPHLLRVLDCSEELPYPHIVMEYVDGTSLSALIQASGCMQPLQAMDMIKQVVNGLAYLHKRGVMHGDIKPENILLGRDGHVRIADLGLARSIGSPVVMEGIVGTPAYMAPEIIEHGMGAASTQSDLYALGATIYHLVTGQPPFVHDDPLHVMQAHVHEHPKPIDPSRHVPKRMQRMIMGLLDKDPSERGDSALLSHHCDDIIASLDATRLSLPGRIMATITHVFSSLRG